jgi:hypothetical protein
MVKMDMADDNGAEQARTGTDGVDLDVIVRDVVKSVFAAVLIVLAAVPVVAGIVVFANGWGEFYTPVSLIMVAIAVLVAGERISAALRSRS